VLGIAFDCDHVRVDKAAERLLDTPPLLQFDRDKNDGELECNLL
jgi:hypothetical protein